MAVLKHLSILEAIKSFFPLKIVFGQLKYNLISLFYWTFLFIVISGSFGQAFGIPLLFYSPEYMGEINALSFGLLGFSIGGFTMAFNTYSYIKLGPRFPFLATVSRPFFKFCVNNFIIPSVFLFFYLLRMIEFQLNEELASPQKISTYISGFLIGYAGFITLSIFYFFPTTREKKHKLSIDEVSNNPIQSVTQSKEKWYDYFRKEKDRTYYYIGKGLKIYQSRPTKHLDKTIIEHVFAQNRINASIFEILTIIAFVISGQFLDYPIFEFPAAMSVVLLLTIIHMLFSALMSWFHRWTYPILFGFLIALNSLSLHTHFFNYTNYAYGLNYENDKIKDYNLRSISKLHMNDESLAVSQRNIRIILENWKKNIGKIKPKLVVLNTSGGGSRSALWTFTVLQNCEKNLNGALSKHLNMITGASGGIIGAAYFREILLRHKKGELTDPFDERFENNLAKDLLNKLSFSASTKDLFYRFQTFNYSGYTYPKDRGYAFEEQLHENTENALQHNLGYYKNPELSADIPLLILSPTIVNDGRRLLISSQSLRFMEDLGQKADELASSFENIDFQSFFDENHPENLRFSSALRASATFPFIMPMVTMPTSPQMQLMDAGIRDNYGTKLIVNYIYSIQKWIKENTSGIIILTIRDTKKILKNEFYHHISLVDKLTLPFGNMYNNFPRTQDFDQEQLLQITADNFGIPINFVVFNLRENKRDKISLSWHLTKQEKKKIKDALNSESNQRSLNKLKSLLRS